MKTQIKLVHSLVVDPLVLKEIDVTACDTEDSSLSSALKEMEKEAQDYLVDPTWVPDSTIFGGHYKDASGNCIVME